MDAGTRLALDRTALAHERTLMAWVRTAVSLISFGFTIYKFFHFELQNRPPLESEILGPRGFRVHYDCGWDTRLDRCAVSASSQLAGAHLPLPRDSGACNAASSSGVHDRRAPGSLVPARPSLPGVNRTCAEDVHALLDAGNSLSTAHGFDHPIACDRRAVQQAQTALWGRLHAAAKSVTRFNRGVNDLDYRRASNGSRHVRRPRDQLTRRV